WGWRVAFLLSIVLLAVGLFIRLRVLETPEFTKQARKEIARVPMWEVLRDYFGPVVLGWGARLIDGIVFTIYAIFPLSYLTTVAKIPRTTVLAAITAAATASLLAAPSRSTEKSWPHFRPSAVDFCGSRLAIGAATERARALAMPAGTRAQVYKRDSSGVVAN